MNIQFDQLGTKSFFEWIANKFVELALPAIKEGLKNALGNEELLSRREVSEKVFKCDVGTFDKNIRYAKGFPKMMVGSQEKYPRKLVEEWIRENSQLNN